MALRATRAASVRALELRDRLRGLINSASIEHRDQLIFDVVGLKKTVERQCFDPNVVEWIACCLRAHRRGSPNAWKIEIESPHGTATVPAGTSSPAGGCVKTLVEL
jgi:hypothetical protein